MTRGSWPAASSASRLGAGVMTAGRSAINANAADSLGAFRHDDRRLRPSARFCLCVLKLGMSAFKHVFKFPLPDAAMLAVRRGWLAAGIAGDGPHLREGSPLWNVSRLEAPVHPFHRTSDRNVRYVQSKDMAIACTAAHAHCELVTFDGLDHQKDC